MNKIKNYIKDMLGISSLEKELVRMTYENREIKQKLSEVRSRCAYISQDNSLILNHIRFLNSNFFAGADIGATPRNLSVLIVYKKGRNQIVKTFEFRNETMEDIHRVLEGFGRENTKSDQPFGPGPKYRY